MVVLRESISELKARLKDASWLHRNRVDDPTDLVDSLMNFSNYVHKRTPGTRNLVLLDNFPIYRWAIPNILLAHEIAGQSDARVAIFSFRQVAVSAKLLYMKLFVDEFIIIRLTLIQKLSLFREYRRLIRYLESNESLIDYRITEIPIGLDIYESILRSGQATLDLSIQQTYRVAYLGLKQFVFFRSLFEKERIKSVLVSHDNYIGPGLLAHMAFHFNVEVILANLFSMTIPEKEFQLYEVFSRYKIYAEYLGERQLSSGSAWAKTELSKRIQGTLGIGIKYQNKSAFDSEFIDRQTSEESVTKVLVLTHDFFDNPHGYARMTFEDFYIWMTFLANISKETNYEWYIKPHRDYSGVELGILKLFLATNTNFHMINPETSFHQLKSEGIDFALTCFGTVGHELPLLGFTVINASYNPHIAFDFNVSTNSQAEYEQILRHISDYKLTSINHDEIYCFYFIHHQIVQSDQFMGISVDALDKISKGQLNSQSELEFLLKNLDKIAENSFAYLESMRATGRVYAFEDFLPPEIQLKRKSFSNSLGK